MSSHRTRKILWDGPHPPNKINSTERYGKLPPAIADGASKGPERSEQQPRPRTQRETHVVRGKTGSKEERAQYSLLAKNLLPQIGPGFQAALPPLRIYKDFQKLRVFSRGCCFLTPFILALVINTDIRVSAMNWYYESPALGEHEGAQTHREFRKQSRGSDWHPETLHSSQHTTARSVPLKIGPKDLQGSLNRAGCQHRLKSCTTVWFPGLSGGEGKVTGLEAHPVQFWAPARLPTNDHCGI